MQVAKEFVIRTAGLEAAVLDRLRCERAHRATQEIAGAHEKLSALAEELSRELYQVIGADPPTGSKPVLVALRRAIHRGLPLKGELRAAAEALPASTTVRVTEWERLRSEVARATAALPELLADDLSGARRELRAVTVRPELRDALVHVQPNLYRSLAGWLAGDDRPPRERQLVSLVKYVARAAAKTSPRSTLTASGITTWSSTRPAWTASGDAPIPARPAPFGGHPAPVRVVVEPDAAALHRIAAALARADAPDALLLVRPNPSLVRTGDQVCFLGAPPSSAVRRMRLTPAVDAILDLLTDLGECSLEEFLRRCGRPPYTQVRQFVAKLIETGLIEARLPVADQEPDLLGRLLQLTSGTDHWQPVTAALTALAADLGRYRAATGPGERIRLAASSNGHLEEAMRLAGLSPSRRAGRHPAAFDEHAILAAPPAITLDDSWEQALTDLSAFGALVTLLDRNLPVRHCAAHYFTRRFGRTAEIPFVLFYEAISEDTEDPVAAGLRLLRTMDPTEGGVVPLARLTASVSPRVREVARLRAGALETLRALRPGADGVVRIPPELAIKLGATAAHLTGPPGTHAYYVQPCTDEDGLRLVLNSVAGAGGRGRTRVERLAGRHRTGDDPLATAPPDDDLLVAELSKDGPLVAELENLFDFTLNARSPAATHAIGYPSLSSTRRPDLVAPLGELTVSLDPITGLPVLRWPRLRRQVVPPHTGVMSEIFLPPPARFLAEVFALTPTVLFPNQNWLHDVGRAEPPRTVVHTPRVDLGRVTLLRRTWAISAAEVPRRASGEDDARFLLRMERWRREAGIPAPCFVRILNVPALRAGTGLFAKSRKPLYFDPANWFLLLALDRDIRERPEEKVLLFTEALPVPAGRVTEFLVEVS
ncbi:lantibiotic dehydratase [Nonomuraea jiangxiensis]|uniref:Lantibiotic dehydratase, C terminus n=1 Tax=Nonomuraea jiangxiensis TaxID=633440 RepID=A0A1G8RZM0_9ACTN|nr:lantibiotic dehydratase [Nonomuraea jiangxiensis]SDJ22417.1 Lantibiotic dehydratase, C terminus [Nonomuraea jiangxiensis]